MVVVFCSLLTIWSSRFATHVESATALPAVLNIDPSYIALRLSTYLSPFYTIYLLLLFPFCSPCLSVCLSSPPLILSPCSLILLFLALLVSRFRSSCPSPLLLCSLALLSLYLLRRAPLPALVCPSHLLLTPLHPRSHRFIPLFLLLPLSALSLRNLFPPLSRRLSAFRRSIA